MSDRTMTIVIGCPRPELVKEYLYTVINNKGASSRIELVTGETLFGGKIATPPPEDSIRKDVIGYSIADIENTGPNEAPKYQVRDRKMSDFEFFK